MTAIPIQLLSLTSAVQRGELVDFRDRSGRLAGFFIHGTDEGKFLDFTTPRGIAQDGIKVSDLKHADYLDINIGIPVFSPRAVEVFERCVPGVMSFYPCVIECEGQAFPFYLARITQHIALVDIGRSSFRTGGEGEQFLSRVVCHAAFGTDFTIARDAQCPAVMAVTAGFRQLCERHGLIMAFLAYLQ